MGSILVIGMWALCGWACYSIAKAKKRNKELWVVLGVFFGIIAVVIVSVLPSLPS